MSNYSRSFDEDRMNDGGGRRGFRSQRPISLPTGKEQHYDGKSQRKPVVRKAIDYYAVLLHESTRRFLYRDYRDRPLLFPSLDAVRDLPPVLPEVARHNPSMGVTSKYISLAVNKIRGPVTSLTWMPDGRRVLTGSHSGDFTLWNGMQFNFEAIVAQAHEEAIRAMQWTPNGIVLLTGDDAGVVKYWHSSMSNVKAFRAHKEPVRDLSSSPSSLHFVTASDDQTASIWDLETSKEVGSLRGHGWDVKSAQWHPSKSIILTGGKDQLIKLWDPRTASNEYIASSGNPGENTRAWLRDLHAHKNTVNRLAWSPLNPYWFASGSRDNLVKVFDIRTMKEFQSNRNHRKEITALTWHPTIDTLFASASYDGQINFWYIGVDTPIELTGAHDSCVHGLEWHPLGHLLASTSNDHTTRFWARNRPGDELSDKYNVTSLPEEERLAAVQTLVEAAQMNPTKYGRLPAALAEIVEQGAQLGGGMGGAGGGLMGSDGPGGIPSALAAYKAASGQDSSAEIIPGMGSASGALRSSFKSEDRDSSYDRGSRYGEDRGASSARDRKRSRSRSREREYERERHRDRDRDRDRDRHRDRDRDRDHERDRDRGRDRDRDRDRDSHRHGSTRPDAAAHTGRPDQAQAQPTSSSFPPPPPAPSSYGALYQPTSFPPPPQQQQQQLSQQQPYGGYANFPPPPPQQQQAGPYGQQQPPPHSMPPPPPPPSAYSGYAQQSYGQSFPPPPPQAQQPGYFPPPPPMAGQGAGGQFPMPPPPGPGQYQQPQQQQYQQQYYR